MALRPLADPQDLAPFLGECLPPEKVLAALTAASALVRAYCRQPEGWATGDVPDPIFQATLFIARRVAVMPESGTGDETVGPFSVKRDASMWMSATEKLLLAGFIGSEHYQNNSISTLTLSGPIGMWPNGDISVPCDIDPVTWAEGDV